MRRNGKAKNLASALGTILLSALGLAPGLYGLTFEFDDFIQVVSSTESLYGILGDVGVALGATLLCVVFGVVFSYLVAHWRVKWLFALGLASSAFASPALALEKLVPLSLPYRLDLVLGLAVLNVAMVSVIVGERWRSLDQDMAKCALSLGAGRFRVFRKVTLPLLRPAVLTSAALVFLGSYSLVNQVNPVRSIHVNAIVYSIAVIALCISQRGGLIRLSDQKLRMDCKGFGILLSSLLLIAAMAVVLYPIAVRSMEIRVQSIPNIIDKPGRLIAMAYAIGAVLVLALISALLSTLIAKATVKVPLFIVMLPWALGLEAISRGLTQPLMSLPLTALTSNSLPLASRPLATLVLLSAILALATMTSVTVPLSSLLLRTRGGGFFRAMLISMAFPIGHLATLSLGGIILSGDDRRLFTLILIAISYILLLIGGRLKRRIHA